MRRISPQMRRLLSTSLPLLLLTSLLAAIPVLQAAASSSSSSPGVSIVRAPESTVAPLGDEVVLVCETSLPPDRFEWSFVSSASSNSISSSSTSHTRRVKYLKTKSHYNNTISHDNDISRLRLQVRVETLGEYRCIAWFGPVAVTSTAARLELASISNATGNAAQWQLPAGNTLIWHCGQVVSNPPPSWSFYHNGLQIQTEGTNGTLLIADVSTANSGSYSCVATNTASGVRVTLPGRLELQVTRRDALPSSAPHLLAGQRQHSKLIARAGETLILLCAGISNPPPKAVWSRPDAPSALHNNRTQTLALGLQIRQLQPQDAGSYICFLDNGQRPAVEHSMQLEVQQAPLIVLPPSANLTNEGERMQLECVASGMPKPQIYWLLNGESSANDVEAELQPNGTLLIHSVEKRHAGYVQCFARNALGEHSAGTLLQVNPKQIASGSEQQQTQHQQQQGSNRHGHGHGRKQKQEMVPPSAPNVTRLSDESVMLRWQVQRNGGLPIQFFKVQYRMLPENNGSGNKRKSWHTTNDNITYGKDRQGGKNFTSSVGGLKADRSYRFRIMAVYSNNDNKESNTSSKFFLQRGAALAPLPIPDLLEIVEYSQTAVVLQWRLDSSADEQLISGYYAYYRPSSSAGEYLKATIDGAASRSFQIGALEPGTIYEFKLQSFSAVAASEFSALKQGRTQRPRTTTTAQPMLHNSLDTTTPSHNDTFRINPLLTGTIGGGAALLLLLLFACLCLCRRRSSRNNQQQQHKPRLAELREDFVPLSACSPNKPRNRHIHITLNPLAQQQQQQQQTLDEKDAQDLGQDMGYFQRPTETLGFNGLGRMSSNSLRRSQRTLERAAASGGNNNHLNQPTDSSADSPRLQSSGNKPGRVIMKRTRLSSRSENLSSGSLNSVGV
ncbi:interference hedgehog [Drosophila nasuta]|uniref:interference hedgehog n=1 Tax=Drosophila nasuta TaxID=42062 RepID=UPI00295E3189|nr:interference hedgehog [Drosophila nasuta]